MTDFIHRREPRPKFLNLLKIRMPITAIASILHRLSGLILFLSLPLIIYGIGVSLKDTQGFQSVQNLLNKPVFLLMLLIALTAIFYHLIAGIRFLLLDLNVGHDLKIARGSAWLVIGLTTVLFAYMVIMVLMA